ncbi:MAG: hypothetical protein P8R42_02010 [Candidatus Binatia bacterium]|nr:hypothetical protein [Candidatus Binatia bacterium]
MNKLLLHLTARGGKKDELVSALPDLSRSLCAGLPNGARATTLVARDDDPMRMTGTGRPTRAFDATLEIRLSESDAGNNLARAVRDLGPRLESRIHADSSAILVGENNVFVSCDPTPIRYQYCMRRRADFSPAAYLARYGEVHSAFGIKTRGIAGYTQFHVDAEASRQAAEASGFGIGEVSSVSELHLRSLKEFFVETNWNRSLGAQEDEDQFVDRANSIMWLSDAAARL